MSTISKTSGVAPAAAAAARNNGDSIGAAARKRRRWSTAQEELAPSRFVRKKQHPQAGGRQHQPDPPCTSSLTSLTAFHYNSNPIFEPNEVRASDSMQSPCVLKAFNVPWQEKLAPLSSLLPAADGAAERSDLNTTIEEEEEELGTDSESAPSMPQSSTSWDGESSWGWGGSQESKDGNDSRATSQENQKGESKELPRTQTVTSLEDVGAQSKNMSADDAPKSEVVKKIDEELELAACETRSQVLFEEFREKFQANSAADLALLKAYKSTIDSLRAEHSRDESAAREQCKVHRDVVLQLATPRDEHKKLEDEMATLRDKLVKLEETRSTEAASYEDLRKRCKSLESQLRDANERQMPEAKVSNNEDLAVKLREAKDAEQNWKTRAEALEKELSHIKSQMGASAAATIHGEESGFAAETVTSETTILVQSTKAIISPSPPAAVHMICSETLAELEVLRTEQNKLRNDLLSADKRVEEAQKERDDVVLAVQSEWDAVKAAFREDKAKLQHELERSREQKAKLERDLDLRHRHKDVERRREEKRVLEIDLEDIRTHSRKLEEETAAVIASLTIVRDGNVKLEDDVRDEKAKLDREREALVSLREERQKIEGERLKLEREREALISLRDERRKIEAERAGVVKAMRGENDKLESEREVLMAMQAYLTKLEMKQEPSQSTGTPTPNSAIREQDKRGKSIALMQDEGEPSKDVPNPTSAPSVDSPSLRESSRKRGATLVIRKR